MRLHGLRLLGLELRLHLVFVGTDVHDSRIHLLYLHVAAVGHFLPARPRGWLGRGRGGPGPGSASDGRGRGIRGAGWGEGENVDGAESNSWVVATR
eukprot:scaffold41305_cov41-Phaeocystis_antarctica.AAC.2